VTVNSPRIQTENTFKIFRDGPPKEAKRQPNIPRILSPKIKEEKEKE
jgi:hypothetical protein